MTDAPTAANAARAGEEAEPELLRDCLQGLKTPLAVAEPKSLQILFENAAFFGLFPPVEDPDAPLPQRIAGLNAQRLAERLAARRPYSFEAEVKKGPRTVSLEIECRAQAHGDGEIVVVECRDLTKQREAEYMLDSYSRMAEKNARELQREKERVEKLLLNIMPRSVYDELRDFGTTTPQRFDQASVLMLDFVGFTQMAVSRDPGSTIAELNDIFSAFDRITELFACERIKTIGDAYVAVSGLPEPQADHTANLARVALRMRRYLKKRNASHPTEWRCRIGIATGPLIGSMVGIQKYVYDIFGPAVNRAARLEAFCEPMQILVDQETYDVLKSEFSATPCGEREVRGFGVIPLYALEHETHGRL